MSMKNIFISISIVMIIFLGCLPIKETSLPSVAVENNRHEILKNALQLTPIWEKIGLDIRDFLKLGAIGTMQDYLILVDYSTGSNNPRLIAYDFLTGNLVWEVVLPEPHLNLLIGQKSIFVSAGRSIMGYDGKTGKKIWENHELPIYRVYAMQIYKNVIYYYYAEDSRNTRTQFIFQLDMDTGELLGIERIPNTSAMLWYQEYNKGYWLDTNKILYIDQTTAQIIWQTQLDTFRTNIKVIDPDQGIILSTSHMEDVMYAINAKNGALKWVSQQQLTSNPVIDNNSLFFLTSGKELIKSDLQTGELVASTSFTHQDDDNTNNLYNLMAVSGDLIAIYFADNSQLTVYKITK